MNEKHHSLRTRLTALLLALICVLGLFPTTAFAAGDTITLKEFGHSGVAYESAALGRCTLHEMTFKNGNQTTTGFCGTKGGDMGNSLQGQTWGNKRSISDPTVETMMAYYYAHSTGVFTDEAIALGVNDVWNAGYRWYMNAWVQACIWRYQQGSMSDPVAATIPWKELTTPASTRSRGKPPSGTGRNISWIWAARAFGASALCMNTPSPALGPAPTPPGLCKRSSWAT